MERKTPLYDRHTAAGGKLVPFAGWLLPVQYSGAPAAACSTSATWESCSSGAPTPWPTSTGS